jgi:hypothetical protein
MFSPLSRSTPGPSNSREKEPSAYRTVKQGPLISRDGGFCIGPDRTPSRLPGSKATPSPQATTPKRPGLTQRGTGFLTPGRPASQTPKTPTPASPGSTPPVSMASSSPLRNIPLIPIEALRFNPYPPPVCSRKPSVVND